MGDIEGKVSDGLVIIIYQSSQAFIIWLDKKRERLISLSWPRVGICSIRIIVCEVEECLKGHAMPRSASEET